jgi:hypothetical protein
VAGPGDGHACLGQYRADWEEKAQVYRNQPKHDWASHSADAFCYLAAGWREMVPEPLPRDPIAELLPKDPGRTTLTR